MCVHSTTIITSLGDQVLDILVPYHNQSNILVFDNTQKSNNTVSAWFVLFQQMFFWIIFDKKPKNSILFKLVESMNRVCPELILLFLFLHALIYMKVACFNHHKKDNDRSEIMFQEM